ncbi:hypothetical protein ABZX30_00740 [Streptomyces sp. NPDC004542]|uniref:hypothetical protein n=1 Tax=Streptomyces sp. NPDC004542 TaxID=3154281 RepID=UPI0033A67C5A
MANERCVSPEDRPRTPGRWLNRATAERLLRGESVEAVDPFARDQAERLAKALGALSADATAADTVLPGEEAALAAFRKARDAREDAAAQARAAHPAAAPDEPADAGLFRIGGRPRAVPRPAWARPVRLALTAVLAVGTLGGVAVAAGSGVLPTPFGDDGPGPAASASGAVSHRRPLTSPSPDGTEGGTSGLLPPGGGASATSGDGASPGASREGRTEDGATGSSGASHGDGTWWGGAPSACRAIRSGKELAPGRERALEGAAGGSARVWTYCKGVLDSSGGATGGEDRHGKDGEDGKESKNGEDGEDGKAGRKSEGGKAGRGGGDDDRTGSGGTGRQRRGRSATPSSTTFAPLAPQRTQTPGSLSPSPTYTAL